MVQCQRGGWMESWEEGSFAHCIFRPILDYSCYGLYRFNHFQHLAQFLYAVVLLYGGGGITNKIGNNLFFYILPVVGWAPWYQRTYLLVVHYEPSNIPS